MHADTDGNTYTYRHTYIRHTCIHTYIHTAWQAGRHTYIYIHTGR